jgi:uncharacterized membrane protein
MRAFVHILFVISLIIKGLSGVAEIIVGIFLGSFTLPQIQQTIDFLTEGALNKNPNDVFANFLQKISMQLSWDTQTFATIYLLGHGLVKVLLVTALLRQKLWAYPIAMIVFGLFMLYQVYAYFLNHSIWMVYLTLFDILLIYLTYVEYRILKSMKKSEGRKN